jgi:uncharacterized membrane protein
MPRHAFLVPMALFYVLAGVMHFVAPPFYLQMMPPWLPAHSLLVQISGVAEIVGGLGLLVPATRVAAAWGIIALLIAVFPANLHIATHGILLQGLPAWMPPPTTTANWVRLPLQGLLIAWAWRYTRE